MRSSRDLTLPARDAGLRTTVAPLPLGGGAPARPESASILALFTSAELRQLAALIVNPRAGAPALRAAYGRRFDRLAETAELRAAARARISRPAPDPGCTCGGVGIAGHRLACPRSGRA